MQEMKKRPTSVTVIAWFLIVVGVIALITNIATINDPMARHLMNKSPLPIPVQIAMTYIGLLITLFAGIAMLKGHNWARFLYVIWSIVGFVAGIAASPMKAPMIPEFAKLMVFAISLFQMVIIAFFLFRPKANAFFSPQSPVLMIDLPGGRFVFPDKSLAAIGARLKAELPSHVEVNVKNEKPPNIRLRDGLWRGASLIIDDTGQQMKLAGIIYHIPSVLADVIIFTASVVIFSILVMIICTAFIGEFVPVLFGVGGAAGFGGYMIVKSIFLAMMRNSWSAEVHQAIGTPSG
jgi:hypothetical protein